MIWREFHHWYPKIPEKECGHQINEVVQETSLQMMEKMRIHGIPGYMNRTKWLASRNTDKIISTGNDNNPLEKYH